MPYKDISPPRLYKSWNEYALAKIPHMIQEHIDQYGSMYGLNCRRLVYKALSLDILPQTDDLKLESFPNY